MSKVVHIHQAGGPSLAMVAAGLFSLQACGEYDSPAAKGSAEWLNSQKGIGGRHFYYFAFPYSKAMQKRRGQSARVSCKIIKGHW